MLDNKPAIGNKKTSSVTQFPRNWRYKWADTMPENFILGTCDAHDEYGFGEGRKLKAGTLVFYDVDKDIEDERGVAAGEQVACIYPYSVDTLATGDTMRDVAFGILESDVVACSQRTTCSVIRAGWYLRNGILLFNYDAGNPAIYEYGTEFDGVGLSALQVADWTAIGIHLEV